MYLNKVFKLYASSKNVVYDNVSKVKLQYDKECNPQLRVGFKDVDCLFNVYPKEWMINEITQDGLLKYDFEKLRSVEPFWKLIVANKALLPLFGPCIQTIQIYSQHITMIQKVNWERYQSTPNGSVNHCSAAKASEFS